MQPQVGLGSEGHGPEAIQVTTVSQAKALPSEHFVTLCAQGKVQKCWLLS